MHNYATMHEIVSFYFCFVLLANFVTTFTHGAWWCPKRFLYGAGACGLLETQINKRA